MGDEQPEAVWSFNAAISALRSSDSPSAPITSSNPPDTLVSQAEASSDVGSWKGLGDFTELFKQLKALDESLPAEVSESALFRFGFNDKDILTDTEASAFAKGVKWRDEYDGADLEDNVEPEKLTAAQLRTRKRAARRARARERELAAVLGAAVTDGSNAALDSMTDPESGEELETLRRSPDRRAVIADIIGRPRPKDASPPTSPSPPKAGLHTPKKKEWPVSNPFLWTAPGVPSPASTKITIAPRDGLSNKQRKLALLKHLKESCPDEVKYLRSSGLTEEEFTPLNVSAIGIHVFVDMSNISIGFHDCLKMARGIPLETHVRRIPMNFHNFSLVLERGRPAAKRILAGSDRTSAVIQAEKLGYETSILDRVHKARTPTPRKHRKSTNGYTSASGISHGETSGSETPGYRTPAQYKWSEQAVDEILHLKISHSILDAEKPSTIVLATGDAAEAEYSDGFLRMVERALTKGWMVELVSFKLNTSSLYRRKEFRARWGPMFRWIVLDDWAEYLIEGED